MNIRERNLKNYGFGDGEGDCLRRYIRSESFTEERLLKQCCAEAKAEIADFLFCSLADGQSYDRISYTKYIPLNRGDFYGYRRKSLALFREKLIADGRYPYREQV